MGGLPCLCLAAAAVFGFVSTGEAVEEPGKEHPGFAIYQKLCTECHGDNGEGVAGEYEEPLYGDRSIASLAGRIDRTMPDYDESLCVGEDAKQVADYIYRAFYSPEAQARISLPPIQFSRLTVPQYKNSVADLVGLFMGGYGRPVGEARGLKGTYYGNYRFRVEKKSPDDDKKSERDRFRKGNDQTFERVDPVIAFDYGDGGPDNEKFSKDEFAVRWDGSVMVEETGTYQFVIRTRNGARLWVNNEQTDANKPGQLIDAWVAAGNEPREEEGSIFLLGGRAYPLRLEYFKYKELNASIELLWKPPHGILQPVPARSLSPERVRESMVVSTPFPPDDRSYGYERGLGISKEWFEAVTGGAIEAATYVTEHLNQLAGTKDGAADRDKEVHDFAKRFIEAAFRRPLSEEQRKQLVDHHFEGAESLEIGAKRAVMFALTSPRFLYPEAASGEVADSYDVANRLAMALWDSGPDSALWDAARKNQLTTPDKVRAQAQRMVKDPRARAKMQGFFHHWLELDRAQNLSKDSKAFPAFDEMVMADLRVSLDLFLDDVVWGEKSDYRDLLLADYLFLNDRLAGLYGKPDKVPAGTFQKVSFTNEKRSGVVTHPFLLSAFAYHNNTSPIHRGVFLTRNIVGMTLKPPPEAVEFKDADFDPSLTMRQKVTELTRAKACMACHSVINPLGFSLENFDAIGRWRTKEKNDKPIDAKSTFKTDEGTTVQFASARDVADFAVKSPSAHRAFVRQLFHHSVKQPANAYGVATLDQLRKGFESSNYNIRGLLVEIAMVSATHGLPEPVKPAPKPPEPKKPEPKKQPEPKKVEPQKQPVPMPAAKQSEPKKEEAKPQSKPQPEPKKPDTPPQPKPQPQTQPQKPQAPKPQPDSNQTKATEPAPPATVAKQN